MSLFTSHFLSILCDCKAEKWKIASEATALSVEGGSSTPKCIANPEADLHLQWQVEGVLTYPKMHYESRGQNDTGLSHSVTPLASHSTDENKRIGNEIWNMAVVSDSITKSENMVHCTLSMRRACAKQTSCPEQRYELGW